MCYWSDLIYDHERIGLCPECSAAMMTRCARPRSGALAGCPADDSLYARKPALKAIGTRRSGCNRCRELHHRDRYAALRPRSPRLGSRSFRIHPTSPGLRAEAVPTITDAGSVYALSRHQLAPNKGTSHLVDVSSGTSAGRLSSLEMDPIEPRSKRRLRQHLTHDVRLVGWADHAAGNRMACPCPHTRSSPPRSESLSRVLLEASALACRSLP